MSRTPLILNYALLDVAGITMTSLREMAIGHFSFRLELEFICGFEKTVKMEISLQRNFRHSKKVMRILFHKWAIKSKGI